MGYAMFRGQIQYLTKKNEATGEDEPNPVAIGFRAKTAQGRYRYFWLYRVKFGIPGANLQTRGDSIEFSTPVSYTHLKLPTIYSV